MTATADARQGQSWQQQASWRHIWTISWPVLLANITFPLVGAADTAMMGRLEDASFVGGVALGSLVFNFIYFGLGFLRMGTTGLVAQAHGRGDATAIEHHMVRGLVLALCLGTGFVLATPLVLALTGVLLAASPAVEALMQQYVGIRLLAVPAAFANMVLLGCLFGRQHMRLVLVQIIFINVTNLALNILFVLGLGMAIEGVALASVAAQWTGLVLTLVLIRWQWRDLLAGIARRVFRFRPAWFDPAAFRRFFVIGGDIMIRTVLILLSEAVLLNNAATIGDLSLATAQLVLVMFSLISFGLDGYAHAAEALVGEAIGRRNLPMLDQVVRRTNILAGISALVISILAWAGGPLIIATLTSQADLAAMTLAHWHWVALLAPVAFMAFQMDGIFIGATRSREMRNAMILAFAGFLLAVLVAGGYGLNGLLAAFTIYLGLRGITLMMRMRHVRAMAMPDDNTARNDTT
ncbi:MAG: MATE family efflux transporter [Alphaproteobacteria bacterium]|jgi:MATE family multidrug resistance protein